MEFSIVLSMYVYFAVKSCSMVLADIRNISEIVYSALVVLIQFCNSVISAKVCMNDLVKCSKSVEKLEALCNAANSGNAPLCHSFKDVKSAMDLCFRKFDFVMQYTKMMEVVVKHCSKASEGMHLCFCVYVA